MAELSLLGSDTDQVRLLLKSPAYQISTANSLSSENITIQVSGIPNDSTPGQPRLPRLSRLVAIPVGVDVTLAYRSPDSQAVPGKYRLPVAGQPQPLAEELTPGTFQPDASLDYASIDSPGSFYPAVPVQISDEAWLRGQRLVRVDFYPIQYAAGGSLRWHPVLEVTLSFTPRADVQPDAAPGFQAFSPLDELAEGLVINPESARRWRDLNWQTTAPIPLGRSASTSDFDETRYKISINEDGLYQVTGAELAAAGLDISQVNPQDFSLTNQGSAVAILIQDIDGNDAEADGLFGATDRVVFYGEKFRGDRMAERYAAEDDLWAAMPTGWQPHMSPEMFEKYSDTNVYWLDVDGPAGLRMAEANGIPVGNYLIPGVFPATVHAEQDVRWYTLHQSDEDTWFWERFAVNSTTIPTTKNYSFELPGIAFTGGPAVLSGELYSDTESIYANPDHHIELSINGVSVFVGEWDGIGRYPFSVEFDPVLLLDGSNNITLSALLISGGSADRLFVDWFEIAYARRFVAQSDQLFFHYDKWGNPWQYQIDGFTSAQVGVFDITNPLTPVVISARPWSGAANQFGIEFQSQHLQSGRYLVTASPLISAQEVASYTFKNLHATTSGADYLIISPAEFTEAAQTLADYRSAQGLRSKVVNLEDVINEFNDGIYHSLAIKSFLAYTVANWVPAPSYVVLVGSGHWNFFGRPGPDPINPYLTTTIYMPPHLVWVDPWQGEVDSASALAAVVGNDILPDLAIGRIPVESAQELLAVIQKIIAYEDQQGSIGRDRLLFIADNQPDLAGEFMDLSEQVISASIPGYQQVDRVYLNDFIQNGLCNSGVSCPLATQALLDEFNHQPIEFVNYTGHASRNYWADELLLKTNSEPDKINDPQFNDLANLNNAGNYPILLSLTCLDGYWIYPSLRFPSLAVNLLRKASGGVAAAYSPTGLGLAHGHDVLNKAFYDSLYIHGAKELGAAVAFSKLKLYETGQNFDLIYTYTIFGDPALRLAPSRVFIPVLPYQVNP